MLDYDKEAARYDATRGGDARAGAAAAAITSLIDRAAPARTLVDVACGTGIVTARLADAGRVVLGVDRSPGMAAVAARRLPGRVAVGDGARLPLQAASVDVVTMVWLLHLIDERASARAIAEAARVLRPGGLLITTVNKNDAMYAAADDAAVLAGQVRRLAEAPQTDDFDRVVRIGAEHGLAPSAGTTFAGLGQGISPLAWRKRLASGDVPWVGRAGPGRMAELDERLAALPEQDRARAEPVYRLVAFRRS